MYSADFDADSQTINVSGDGTFILDVNTAYAYSTESSKNTSATMTTTGNWVVSGNLQLVNDAADILTTTSKTTGSVTLDGGTISLVSGSVITQAITVTENGGGLAVYEMDSSGALTLNSAIYATSLEDISLNMNGVALTLGDDFAIYLENDLTAEDIAIFTNAASITGNITFDIYVDNELITSYVTVNEDGSMSVIPEPATASLSLIALAGLMIRRRRQA